MTETLVAFGLVFNVVVIGPVIAVAAFYAVRAWLANCLRLCRLLQLNQLAGEIDELSSSSPAKADQPDPDAILRKNSHPTGPQRYFPFPFVQKRSWLFVARVNHQSNPISFTAGKSPDSSVVVAVHSGWRSTKSSCP